MSLAQLAIRCLALVVLTSLLTIPVQCDASPVPHSLFLDPIETDGSEHEHGQSPGSADVHASPAHNHPAGPVGIGDALHHSRLFSDADADELTALLDPNAVVTDRQDGVTADTGSMQSLITGIDAPLTVSLPSVIPLKPAVSTPVITAPDRADRAHGIASSPASPPPR